MINKKDKITIEQVHALQNNIFCSIRSTVSEVVRGCVNEWDKSPKKIITICKALEKVGLSEVIDYAIDDVLVRLHCLAKNDFSVKTDNGLSISELTPILYNFIKLAEKDARFSKVNNIPKKELSTYFPYLTKENINTFIQLGKQGLIDIPDDVAALLGEHSFVEHGTTATINYTIDLLNLTKDVNILPLFEYAFSHYFINNPTLEHVKADLFKNTLALLDSPIARNIEKQLNSEDDIFDFESTFSIHININNIKRLRAKLNLQSDSIDILFENTINCFGKAIKDGMYIFKDYIPNKQFVEDLGAIQKLDRNTKTYLYSRMEFLHHPNEDIQLKKEFLHTFFKELIKLEGTTDSQTIFNLMQTTALYYEMHTTLPENCLSKKRNNKI